MEPSTLQLLPTERISRSVPATTQTPPYNMLSGMTRLTLQHKLLFDQYLTAFPPQISDLTFGNLFSWNSVLPHFFYEEQGHLIVAFVDWKGAVKFFQPIGPEPAQCMKSFIKRTGILSWTHIEKTIADVLSAEGYICYEDRNNWDYIYSLDELRGLKGKKWHAKRRFLHRCEEYRPVVKTLDASMMKECLALNQTWLINKNGPTDADTAALMTALTNFDALQLSGVAVYIDNHIEGFAVGEKLNPTTFVAHFLKANIERTGLFQFTLHELVKMIPTEFKILNQEQDLGLEGLRTAKERWHPIGYVQKSTMIAS